MKNKVMTNTLQDINEVHKNIIQAVTKSNESQQCLLSAISIMPKQYKEELSALKVKIIGEVDGKISSMNKEINGLKTAFQMEEISAIQASEIEKERRRRIVYLLGSISSVKYTVFAHGYFSALGEGIKNKFSPENTTIAFKHLKKKQFPEVIKYIRSWRATKQLDRKIVEDLWLLRDKMENYRKQIDTGKISESKKGVLIAEIHKNEKKLYKFDQYMNKNYNAYLK